MKYVRLLCIAVFGVALIAVALANREVVNVKVLPNEVAGLFAVNPSIEMPLFLVIFGGILVGLLVGFLWEWVREHAQRAEAAKQGREMRRLEREVKKLKGEKHAGKDDVLALLDETA